MNSLLAMALMFGACMQPAPPTRAGYYIGNSLTRDSSPLAQWRVLEANGYESGGGYDIRCGLPLNAIADNQPGLCGIASPAQWQEALTTTAYDYLVLQPHWTTAGTSTLATDVAAFSMWADMQPPSTQLIIYAAVAPRSDLLVYWGPRPPVLSPLTDPLTTLMPSYFGALWEELEPRYGARLKLAPVGEVTHQLAVLLGGVDELYRDPTHASAFGAAVATLTLATVIAGHPIEATAADVSGLVGNVTQHEVAHILHQVSEIVLRDWRTRVKPRMTTSPVPRGILGDEDTMQ